MTPTNSRDVLIERFFAKIEQPANSGACWRWIGAIAKYPVIAINGKNRQAHVVSWEIRHRKPFPSDMFGLHSCDNTWCVNPEHVRPGTAKDNTGDAIERGRFQLPEMTQDVRKKISAALRGHAVSETTRAKIARSKTRELCKRGHPRVSIGKQRGCPTCRNAARREKRKKL